jgi:hypothetical protein
MALQPNSGPGLPCWGFLTITFLRGWIVSPAPNPQPRGPGLRIYDSQRQSGPAVPPGTGYHFSRILQHACVTVGLFFNPGHHKGEPHHMLAGYLTTDLWNSDLSCGMIPEDKSELHTRRRENLKSHTDLWKFQFYKNWPWIILICN